MHGLVHMQQCSAVLTQCARIAHPLDWLHLLSPFTYPPTCTNLLMALVVSTRGGAQVQPQQCPYHASHVTNMLPLKCIFGQGYCYNCALLFTTDFLSWPMETTIAST